MTDNHVQVCFLVTFVLKEGGRRDEQQLEGIHLDVLRLSLLLTSVSFPAQMIGINF